MHALVTGAAGFIGFHLARLLLGQGHRVTGIDNLCDYYSVRLKEDRLHLLEGMEGFSFVKGDLADKDCMERLFAEGGFTHVVNLAAQAGVRYSLINPMAYISSNIVGFANILEGCRRHAVRHLVFASSSSVYGLDATQPYTPHQAASHPVSLYAATKRSDELMAHAYAHLYGIPCTGLRFFTVYGPWGRPDMALSIFASAMRRGEPLKIFNQGRMRRDFTYIDDIVEPMARLLDMPPAANPGWDAASADPATSSAPWRILNLGRGQTVELGRFIETLEEVMGRAAVKEYLPMQDGDVLSTWSDISDAEALTGWTPRTSLKEGIARFYEWFASYYDPSRC